MLRHTTPGHVSALHRMVAAHRQLHLNRRARKLRAIRVPHKAEMRYNAGLLALVATMRSAVQSVARTALQLPAHDQVRRRPSPLLRPRPFASYVPVRSDLMAVIQRSLDAVMPTPLSRAEILSRSVAADVIDSVDDQIKAAFREQVGIDVNKQLGFNEPLRVAFEARVAENVALIQSIPEQYLDKIEEAVTRNYAGGLPDGTTLMDEIMHIGGVTESRARFIARDQTAKMVSDFNQERQKQVGVTSYIWSTSLDERVRPSHAELEGLSFTWDAPPEPGNPGDDYNCRCVAIPLLEDAESDDGDDTDAGSSTEEEPEEADA